MIIKLKRYLISNMFTIGKLCLENGNEYYTLERPYKNKDDKGCIPEGEYDINFRTHGNFYDRYKEFEVLQYFKGIPEILNVPDFTDILIHCGNTVDDTKGCILVGNDIEIKKSGIATLKYSRSAFICLYRDISESKDENIKIIISNC